MKRLSWLTCWAFSGAGAVVIAVVVPVGAQTPQGGAGPDTTVIDVQAAEKIPTAAPAVAPNDVLFAQQLARDGIAELEVGNLAMQRVADMDLKSFAKQANDDHVKTDNKLKSLAQDRKIALPQTLDTEQAARQARLEKLSGRDFDLEYLSAQIADHQKTMAWVQLQIDRGHDRSLRQFAVDTLPVVRMHLAMATELHAKLVGAQTPAEHNRKTIPPAVSHRDALPPTLSNSSAGSITDR